MARTDKFREQHVELLGSARELESLLDVSALCADGAPARRSLSKLLGKLSLHLANEDKGLYPQLRTSSDAALAALATQFSTEMEGTAKAVAAYSQKWATPTAIKSNAAEFAAETRKLLQVLADRIKRENQQLYAAADRAA